MQIEKYLNSNNGSIFKTSLQNQSKVLEVQLVKNEISIIMVNFTVNPEHAAIF